MYVLSQPADYRLDCVDLRLDPILNDHVKSWSKFYTLAVLLWHYYEYLFEMACHDLAKLY